MGPFFMYAFGVPWRRRLSYLAASVIAAAGMFTGHAMGRGADDTAGTAHLVGIFSWVAAGIVAVLIDRSVPPRAVGFASLALPLVWFGGLLVSEGVGFWFAALVLLGAFALLAGASAAIMKWLLQPRGRHRRSRRIRY